jgi:hypothetical protein
MAVLKERLRNAVVEVARAQRCRGRFCADVLFSVGWSAYPGRPAAIVHPMFGLLSVSYRCTHRWQGSSMLWP